MSNRQALWFLFSFLYSSAAQAAGVSVLTWHNDLSRTGANTNETTLTPSNVNSSSFGKLFTYIVDGQIYAQPLVVPNVVIGGIPRNVVYIATEHDSVYAFDADGSSTTPLWHVSFINGATVTTVPVADAVETRDITVEYGITSTPVIDPASGVLYVNAITKEFSGSTITYVQRLHALDLATGAERLGGPVALQASVPGTGAGSDGTTLSYNALWQNQRAALTLANGNVYIASAAHGVYGPFHGWVLAYNALTLQLSAVFNASPNGIAAGIWQSGAGAALDASGNLYMVTGDGPFDATDYGDSAIRLTPGAVLTDYFTPHDAAALFSNDIDLGSSGGIALPDQPGAHPHLFVFSGKPGNIYLVDRDNMGHFNAADDSQIVQEIQGVFPSGGDGGVYIGPVYWSNRLYFAGVRGVIKLFALSGGLLSPAPTSQTAISFGNRGGAMSLSSNGDAQGILWAVDYPTIGAPAVLHAYDATDLAKELYNSLQAPGSRDYLGVGMKFTPPTIVNGKVYVAGDGHVTVLGPIQAPASLPVRIDAGDWQSNYTDPQNNVWLTDRYYTPAGFMYSSTAPIAGTDKPALYQTEHWGMSSYDIPLPNGTYQLNLHFAEIYWTAPGQRIFSVSAQGQPLLTNFDIAAKVGANTADIETFTVSVTNQMLHLGFVDQVDHAKISAIEVLPSTSPIPTITSPLAAAGQVGTSFRYQVTASNQPTSFSAAGLPAGLSINTGNGLIAGTPRAAVTTTVTLGAANAFGVGTAQLPVYIAPAPAAAPVITSTLTAAGQVGVSFRYLVTATNSPTSYGASGLPLGLTINTGNGLIAGTPRAAGTFTVTLSATNAGGTGTAALRITIGSSAPATPVITSPATASGQVGVSFRYLVTATNSPTSYGAAGLPLGLTINTGNGLIAGTPRAAGDSIVTLSASNAGGTGTAPLTLSIAASAAPTAAMNGVGDGISVSPTNLTGIRVFPNPWRADRHSGRPVTFDNLPANSTVKIFTVSAHWVKTLSAPGGSAAWDLTNDSGDPVASGIYLYRIMDSSDNKTVGQVVVIR